MTRRVLLLYVASLLTFSDEEWSDDEKGDGKEKDDLEEMDEQQLGELLAREQRARHMGLSQVGCYAYDSICRDATINNVKSLLVFYVVQVLA